MTGALRQLVGLGLLLTGLASIDARGAALGAADVESWLGDPLQARIGLELDPDESLEQVVVRIADRATHERFEVPYDAYLSTLRTRIVEDADGVAIAVDAVRPLASFHLEFIVEVLTIEGTVLRAYSIVPEVFVAGATARATAGATAETSAAARAAARPDQRGAATRTRRPARRETATPPPRPLGPPIPAGRHRVMPDESLWNIARRMDPALGPLRVRLAALRAANPAFATGSALAIGDVLEIPSSVATARAPAPRITPAPDAGSTPDDDAARRAALLERAAGFRRLRLAAVEGETLDDAAGSDAAPDAASTGDATPVASERANGPSSALAEADVAPATDEPAPAAVEAPSAAAVPPAASSPAATAAASSSASASTSTSTSISSSTSTSTAAPGSFLGRYWLPALGLLLAIAVLGLARFLARRTQARRDEDALAELDAREEAPEAATPDDAEVPDAPRAPAPAGEQSLAVTLATGMTVQELASTTGGQPRLDFDLSDTDGAEPAAPDSSAPEENGSAGTDAPSAAADAAAADVDGSGDPVASTDIAEGIAAEIAEPEAEDDAPTELPAIDFTAGSDTGGDDAGSDDLEDVRITLDPSTDTAPTPTAEETVAADGQSEADDGSELDALIAELGLEMDDSFGDDGASTAEPIEDGPPADAPGAPEVELTLEPMEAADDAGIADDAAEDAADDAERNPAGAAESSPAGPTAPEIQIDADDEFDLDAVDRALARQEDPADSDDEPR